MELYSVIISTILLISLLVNMVFDFKVSKKIDKFNEEYQEFITLLKSNNFFHRTNFLQKTIENLFKDKDEGKNEQN